MEKMEYMMEQTKVVLIGNSLAVQWLGLHASAAGDMGLIPGQGTKIPCLTVWPKRKKKEK